MRALCRIVLASLSLWLAGAVGAWAAEPAAAEAEAPTAQQVLVMLRLPEAHYRSGGGYAGSYGGGAGRAARLRIADRIARTHGLTLETGWPMPLLGVDCFVMRAPAGRPISEVVAVLEKDRDVVWSQPMQTYRAAAAAPNDPMYRLQPATQAWRLTELHQIATGRNVRVAVVDSAVDGRHPDLVGQIGWRQDFVIGRPASAERHGTGVAGVIAARRNNEAGIVGVAPDARLMALRACWQDAAGMGASCDTLSLAKAIEFAVEHDAQVINMSLSGPPDTLLGRLLDAAIARRTVVVGAVDPALPRGGFPASHAGVVAVASDPGQGSAFVAPGHDVLTTQPGGGWGLANGSSFSAAHVSGLFALVWEREPRGGKPSLIRAGAGGTIDACASILRVSAACPGCACPPRTAAVAAGR